MRLDLTGAPADALKDEAPQVGDIFRKAGGPAGFWWVISVTPNGDCYVLAFDRDGQITGAQRYCQSYLIRNDHQNCKPRRECSTTEGRLNAIVEQSVKNVSNRIAEMIEKLKTTGENPSDIIARHSAGKAQEVTAEMVETGAQAIYESENDDGRWSSYDDDEKHVWHVMARACIRAALVQKVTP